ncbi:MAG: SdrD B-like domain-containing protein, partial [Bacteroidota bacterium]
NGNVSLNGVPADQFVRLIFSLKDSNHAFTIANKPGVNENKDSNADRITGRTAVFKTSKGAETILNQDCGQWSPGSVEAYVWDDRNGNGKRDGSEPPLEGVNVELVHHSSGQIITNAYTDQSGVASLAGLPADQGVHLTFYLKDATHAFTIANKASVNENQDSDANRTTGQTAVFFTDRGAQTITNQDAGQWSPGIVEARIWNDLNNNGKQDGSEHGLPFVQVDLIQQGGIVLLSTLSDASGIARFEIVPADRNLKLKFHKRANTFTQTTVDKPGVNENRDSDARLPTGETGLFKTDRGRQLITNLDAGFVVDYTDDTDNDGIPDFQDKYLLDNTNDGKAAITSRVWDDQNADGLQSSGEKGLGEVEVYLYDAVSNTLLSSTITHPYNGEAVFFDIPPAAMRFLEYIVPSGLSFSSQDSGTDDDLDSDINPIDGRSPSFVALAVVSAFDAGLSTPTSAPARLATEEVAIQAYPNPTSGKLNLEGIAGYERVRIFDARGQLIQVHALTEGQNQLSLTISDLAAGIYFLRIESADTVKTEQIVKR